MWIQPSHLEIAELLRNAKTIAVLGASSNPSRPSHGIMDYLLSVGYQVIPVNPKEPEVLGQKSYPDLASIPFIPDIVDVFRQSDAVPGIVEEAIAKGAKAIWLQEGVIHLEAAERAQAAGLLLVMDRCIYKDHVRLG